MAGSRSCCCLPSRRRAVRQKARTKGLPELPSPMASKSRTNEGGPQAEETLVRISTRPSSDLQPLKERRKVLRLSSPASLQAWCAQQASFPRPLIELQLRPSLLSCLHSNRHRPGRVSHLRQSSLSPSFLSLADSRNRLPRSHVGSHHRLDSLAKPSPSEADACSPSRPTLLRASTEVRLRKQSVTRPGWPLTPPSSSTLFKQRSKERCGSSRPATGGERSCRPSRPDARADRAHRLPSCLSLPTPVRTTTRPGRHPHPVSPDRLAFKQQPTVGSCTFAPSSPSV